MSFGQRKTVEALEARFRAAKDVVERSHCQVVGLSAKGHSAAEVAEIVALSPRWVNELERRYAAEGADALGDQPRNRGAKPLLSAGDQEALRERQKAPPDDGGVWSGPKMARWIAARRGLVHVHPPRGWGGAAEAALVAAGAAAEEPAGGGARSAVGVQKLGATLGEERARHAFSVELRATDEHRLGLKPVRRRQLLRVLNLEPAVLRLPPAKGLGADPVLTADLVGRPARLAALR